MTILQPRVALYAVISAIEEDLRGVLARGLGVSVARDIFGQELATRAQDRAHRDLGDRPVTVGGLLPYIDFGDAWQLVSRHSASLPPVWSSTAKELARRLENLAGTRNRVMHTRPLDFEDLPLALETAQRLAEVDSLEVPRLRETLRLLAEDPATLDRDLPALGTEEQHNLPYPDFDETGFVGRRNTIDQVKSLCVGPYPVITILGEGGMGKTAAAVKVAYELLDEPHSPFEATIWCSSKTTQLTAGDVVSIEGAITSSLGLLEAVATELVQGGAHDPMEEVLAYMAEFRILLILDNLETVLDDRIRNFLTRLPIGSKVLITSRIGLGTLEHPVRLPKLADDEAVDLLRSLSRVRGVEDLVRMDNRRLVKHCRRMDNNPLWIKWFVSGVQAGVRPEALLGDPSRFLEFSMSNVYGYLSDESRLVLQAMQGAPGKKSQSELVFLSGLTVEQLQAAVTQLCVTNMVTMLSSPVGSSFETRYALGELPRAYLSKHHSVDPDAQRRIARKARELKAAGEQLKREQAAQPYRLRSLDLRSHGNLIVAKHLLQALDAAKEGAVADAKKHVATAKQLAPEWYEVHRVDALVRVKDGDVAGAQEAFEGAIELEPESAALRLRYGMFRLDHLDDPAGAIDELTLVLEQDPHALDCRLELVRAYQRALAFDDAQRNISELFAQRLHLSQHKLRMLHDLELQQWMRRAESLGATGDAVRGIRALASMKKAYEGCPKRLRDDRIHRRLAQVVPVARRLIRRCADEDSRHQAERFIEWAVATERGGGAASQLTPGTSARGTVVRLVPDRGFGFLRLADGEDVFLHYSELQCNEDEVQEGDELVFELGPGREGMQALKARMASALPSG